MIFIYSLCFTTLLFLPNIESTLLIDTNMLNILKNFKIVRNEECLVILLGDWTADETILVQTTFLTTGFLRLDQNVLNMTFSSDQSCQITMFKTKKFLKTANQLCKLPHKSNCISILFSAHSGEEETSPEDKNLSIPVILVRLRYTPQFMFRVQSFYSLWYPQCGMLFTNLFIHRVDKLFKNEVSQKRGIRA